MPFNYIKPLTCIFLLFAVSLYYVTFVLPTADVESLHPNLASKFEDRGIEIPSLGLGTWLSEKSKVPTSSHLPPTTGQMVNDHER